MRIKTFTLDDYPSVVELWEMAGLGFRLGDDMESVRVKLGRDPELFLVAEEDGKIVGSVMGAWDGRRGWIYHLGVLPSHRKRGVATRLIMEVEDRMRRKWVLKVNGLVYGWNKASVSFFFRNGYGVQAIKEAEKQPVEWRDPLVAPKKSADTKFKRP